MAVSDAAIYDAIGEEVSRIDVILGVKTLARFLDGYWASVNHRGGGFSVQLFGSSQLCEYGMRDERDETHYYGVFRKACKEAVERVARRLHLRVFDDSTTDTLDVSYRLVNLDEEIEKRTKEE